MTRDPIYVIPEETLERAALMMLNRRISGLPVVDGDEVVGMITETDVFRAFVDVLGMNDKGARIVMTLKTPDALLDELRERAGTMVVRSVVTYHDPHSREWKAVVRLRGRVPHQVSA
jgi:acetoin utilization protein AcuB